MKIERLQDCGNSPKNLFAQTFAITFAKRDARAIRRLLSDDISWRIAGGVDIRGVAQLSLLFGSLPQTTIASCSINHVATHGRAGAVQGVIEHIDQSTIDYCHVFDYADSTYKRISNILTFYVTR